MGVSGEPQDASGDLGAARASRRRCRSRRRQSGGLSVAQQQLVEVARALALRPRILVMDEPTSALSTREQAHLLSFVRDLRARGITILYISHRLDEVFRDRRSHYRA